MFHKKIALLLFFAVSSSFCSNQLMINEFFAAKNKWALLYYLFIDKAEKKASSWLSLSKRTLKTIAASGSTYLAFLGLSKFACETRASYDSAHFLNVVTTLCSLPVAWSYFKASTLWHEKMKAFKQFIYYWPQNKAYTPEELHLGFERLYQLSFQTQYNQDQLFEEGLLLTLQSMKLHEQEILANLPALYINTNNLHTIISYDVGTILHAIFDGLFKLWYINHKEDQKTNVNVYL